MTFSKLVICCFKPSQPQRITSGLKKTFTKRYNTERRPEEQNEKMESCRENLWNTFERAIKTEIDTRTE